MRKLLESITFGRAFCISLGQRPAKSEGFALPKDLKLYSGLVPSGELSVTAASCKTVDNGSSDNPEFLSNFNHDGKQTESNDYDDLPARCELVKTFLEDANIALGRS